MLIVELCLFINSYFPFVEKYEYETFKVKIYSFFCIPCLFRV